VDEIAEMLGSESHSARQNAQEILEYAQNIKRGEHPVPISVASDGDDKKEDHGVQPALL